MIEVVETTIGVMLESLADAATPVSVQNVWHISPLGSNKGL